MDKDMFIEQLALVLSDGGHATVARAGSYFVLTSGNQQHKVTVPGSKIPWLTASVKRWRETNR